MGTVRETKRVRPAAQRGSRGGHRRLHQRRQVEPAQPADQCGGTGRGRALRHPGPEHPPGRAADGRVYTLSDTVGFVRHLPHQLIEAFRSTLEEVGQADLVVHVVDGAHPDPEEQVRAVHEVLAEVGADRVTELLVVNKIDAADEETLLRLKREWPDAVFVSARSGVGMAELRSAIEERLPRPAVEVAPGCRTTAVTWWPGCTSAARYCETEHVPEGTVRPGPGRSGAGRGACSRT